MAKQPKTQGHRGRAKNIGTIRDFAFDMPVPGLYEIRGPNATGKTTLINAFAKAGGAKDVEVSVTDGERKGELVVDDIPILKVGRVDRRTGQVGVTLESVSPLAILVDPMIKDRDASNRARIGALLQMLEIQTTDDTLAKLVGGDKEALAYLDEAEGLEQLKDLDIVQAQDLVRRALHKWKREFQDEAARAEGEMRANSPHESRPAQVDGWRLTVAQAQEKYDSALRVLERLSGEASQRTQREREREELKGNLMERPDPVQAQADWKAAEAALSEKGAVLQDLQQQCRQLQQQIAVVTVEYSAAEQTVADKQQWLKNVEHAAEKWDRQRATLESEITGATQADVHVQESSVARARADVEVARQVEAYNQKLDLYTTAQRLAESAAERAKEIEVMALAVTGHLGELVQEAGDIPLTVDEEGVLCYVHSGEAVGELVGPANDLSNGPLHQISQRNGRIGRLEPFYRLSLAQRVRIGCRFLSKAIGSEDSAPIVAVPWEYGGSLVGENKVAVALVCEEENAYFLTEIPTAEGPLRIERFDPRVAPRTNGV